MRVDMRSGYSLLELITALALTSMLGAVMIGLLLAQLHLARAATEHVIAAEAVRTTAAVVAGEARRGVRDDVRAFTRDSLLLRSFRGLGVVCDTVPGGVRVRYRGDRWPDARKDSVLLLPAAGSARAVTLVDVRSAPDTACSTQSGEVLIDLKFFPAATDAALTLVFESGAYYLTARALRFRLGAEGRQPLTSEAFVQPNTQFLHITDDALHFVLTTTAASPRVLSAAFAFP